MFAPNNTGGETYSILMPPPNVTGSLHVGHALTYTIQDILIRYHRQHGYDALWQSGVDHAGIATQMVVTKELEASGVDISAITREELIHKIWEWKDKSGNRIVEQQKSLGCSAPWDLSRFTMDKEFCAAVIKAFVALYKEGLIFRDKRLVNWDTKLMTAISDLEIRNEEEEGTLWHIKYKIVDSDEYVTIATTRPETMFGDAAVAVHPEDGRYTHLIGRNALIPYANRTVPVITDKYIDIEKGTGCLKVTPAHDYNDFAIGKRHGLDVISVIDKSGHMTFKNVPEFLQGIYVKKARKLLLSKLAEDGAVVREEKITHTLPYGDRSGTVIEPLLTDQWFVDAKALAKAAVEAVERGEMKFHPEKWVNTYLEWMRNIEPWCVSRQIVWGHQIPAWYGSDGSIFVEEDEATAIARAEERGISKDQLTRDPDVLDTWFSSALWPFVTLGWPDDDAPALRTRYPTSVLVTGFDIIFFWVARMAMMSLRFMKKVPFRDVYIHALIRDSSGQKMSKSKGNVVDPQDLMDEFGADALRFTLAFMSVPGRDIKLGKDNVKISRNFITKIWNAARFLQFKETQFCSELPETVTGKINNWLIAKLRKFQQNIDQNIREYRFDYATRNIQSFLRDTFCDFFIEAMKLHEDERAKIIAGKVFVEFLRISHPFIPFVTDRLARSLGVCDSLLMLGPDVSVLRVSISEKDEEEVDQFIELLHQVRSARQSNGDVDGEYLALLERQRSWPGELNLVATRIA
jgi:valyl-tRNA synthetase